MFENRNLIKAIEDFRKGKPVLIYDADGREEETDIVFAGELVDHSKVRILRKHAGGLLCLAVHSDIARVLKLPYLTDVFDFAKEKFEVFNYLKAEGIPYDEKSSFSITINHKKTFTGISDGDRALTIKEFSKLADEAYEYALRNGKMQSDVFLKKLARHFRTPGHVILLIAKEGLTLRRQGHTELSVALAEMSNLTPVAAICEMLGEDESSLPKKDAMKYAEKNGLTFIEGSEIIEAYERHAKNKQKTHSFGFGHNNSNSIGSNKLYRVKKRV